jgi:ABC-type phosphate/phosphonate transport system substrate-binding protein
MKVEFTPVTDYPAAVEALVNKQVDLVWFGGFTHVQAQIRSGGKIIPIAQREEDTQFRSVFITQTDSGIKQPVGSEGQDRELRLAVEHLGPPDAAQLPAAGRHRARTATSSASPIRARTTPPSPRW